METVTKRNRFDGNSFDGYAPCFRTCRQRRPIFGANPRRANVFEVMTNCHQLGFLAFRRVLSRSLGLAACRTRYSSPLQLWVGSLARCGRLAFAVAVENKLIKRNIQVKIFVSNY